MRLRAACLLLAALLLGGCQGAAYLGQAAIGQARLLAAREPLDRVIADSSRPQSLRDRLTLVRELREFAGSELGMGKLRGFSSFVATGRRSVVWNVVAAPEFAIDPLRWCFPVAGCVSYRGYFSRDGAERFARLLAARGNDTYVYGVSAYSTLGWFSDPVLDTWIQRSETEVAALVFHEFAHQIAWSKADTGFSEAFAQVVEREGVRRWLAARGEDARYEAYVRRQSVDAEFAALVERTRDGLASLYAEPLTSEEKRVRKPQLLAALREEYVARSRSWPPVDRRDGWMAGELDNARLASVSNYEAQVPALQALLAREHGELAAFYRAARRLAALASADRAAELAALGSPGRSLP